METEKTKYASQARYDKRATKGVYLKLNKKTDIDILDALENVENKQGYIKELIRKDLKKNKKKKTG